MFFVVSGMAQFQHVDCGREGVTITMTRKPPVLIHARNDAAALSANLIRAKNAYGHFRNLSGN